MNESNCGRRSELKGTDSERVEKDVVGIDVNKLFPLKKEERGGFVAKYIEKRCKSERSHSKSRDWRSRILRETNTDHQRPKIPSWRK